MQANTKIMCCDPNLRVGPSCLSKVLGYGNIHSTEHLQHTHLSLCTVQKFFKEGMYGYYCREGIII